MSEAPPGPPPSGVVRLAIRLLALFAALVMATALVGGIGFAALPGRRAVGAVLAGAGLLLGSVSPRAGLILLTLLFPFFMNQPMQEDLYLVDLFLGGVLLPWLVRLAQQGRLGVPLSRGFVQGWLAFLLPTLLSAATAAPLLIEVLQGAARGPMLYAVLRAYDCCPLYALRAGFNALTAGLLVLFAASVTTDVRMVRRVVTGMAWLALLIAAYSLVNYYVPHRAFADAIRLPLTLFRVGLSETVGGRMHSIFWNPGWLAIYVAVALPVTVWAASWTRGGRRVILVSGAFMLAWVLVASGSRMAVAATIAAFLVVAVLERSRLWAGIRGLDRRLLAVIGGGAAAGLLAALLLAGGEGARKLTGGVGSDVRFVLWGKVLGMWAEHPVFGSGLGSFVEASREFSEQHGKPRLEQLPTAHNTLLHALVERGVAGAVGLGWLVGAGLLVGWRAYAARRMDPDRTAVLALLHPLIALLLIGLTDYLFFLRGIELIFAVTLGMLAGVEARSGAIAGRSPRWGAPLLGALVILGVAGLWVTPQRSARGWHQWETTQEGARFRWTQRQAAVVLPVQGTRLVVPVMSNAPDLPQRPIRVVLRADGEVAGQRALREPGRWETLEYVLPASARSPLRVVVEVDRVWTPQAYGTSQDGRLLGVAVGVMRWE
ncbi:MAG: O-antigen ligase family protein [Deltaproteobacteria bacterium]|nr:O-antigen ligase family protein [Deltaproteobacteria bacterium]